MTRADGKLIIAGGGLAGCLAALALARLRPDVQILLIEAGATFGGNHTWSFFDSDVAGAEALVEPLIAARWAAHEVAFPARARVLPLGYNSVTSGRLDEAVRAALRPDQYRLDAAVAEVAPGHVLLANGERIEASGIIDARGPIAFTDLELGWQKFVGAEYEMERPHGLDRPVIMDATVEQIDGYRFVYCLPFSPTRLLVEDTYYSTSPALDAAVLRGRIEAYAASRGWVPREVVREEQGVLPVVIGGRIESLWTGAPVPKLGLRGGFFHPTTGYSLPDAARTALLIARQPDLGTGALHALLRKEAERLWKDRRFYRLLNRMLFHAAAPEERYRVLEHFYRLDPQLVARFYAGRLRAWDKARILSGRPPVPVGRAIRTLAR